MVSKQIVYPPASQLEHKTPHKTLKLALLITLIIPISCTTFKKKEEVRFQAPNPYEVSADNYISDRIAEVCWEGVGKGKLSFETKSHSFEYESILDKINYIWNIGVFIPFVGEEVLVVKWENPYKKNAIPSGDFYERIIRSLSKLSSGEKKLLYKTY